MMATLSRDELIELGWSNDVSETDRVVVWGHGISSTTVVRTADSDLAYATKRARAWIESINTTDPHAEGFIDDYWCVSLDPRCVSAHDLDSDPSVVGYEVVETIRNKTMAS